MEVFSRQEVDFWCNYLKNDPGLFLTEIAVYRASQEPITINEIRRKFGFPESPSGDVLLDGSTPDLTPPSKDLALYAKARIQSNNANITDEVFATMYPKIQQLIDGV